MKFLRKYGIAVVAALTIVMSSCGDAAPIVHGTEYTLVAPDGTDTTDMNAVYTVIATRLHNLELDGDFEMSSEGNKIVVRVREGKVQDPERLRKLLQTWSGLMFRATYNTGEIGATVSEAQETYLRLNHVDSSAASGAGLAAYLMPTQFPDGPLIAYCLERDTSAVGAILRTDSIAMLFPPDLVFHWGKRELTPDGQMKFGLFACKTGRNHEVGGEHVAQATKQYNQQSGSASPEIVILFNSTGTEAWAALSKANIGRSIAIEVGDFVYSYPNVIGEMTGGSAVLTGNFSNQEADELVLILSSGTMPLQIRIVDEHTF